MAKFTYTTLAGSNFSAILTSLNNNFAAVQTAFESTLFRDGTDPNHMTDDLDMNSQRIINLIAAVDDTEPVRLAEFEDLDARVVVIENQFGTITASVTSAQNFANAASASAAAASTAQTAAETAQAAAEAAAAAIGTLDSLSDVTITSPNTGEALVYDGAEWVNDTVSTVATLDDLTDVVISSVADNEVLAYDNGSGNWINQTAAEAGLAAASHTHSSSDITDLTEVTQDTVGAMFSGNTETLITATYQDADGTIDLVVDDDLANYDNTNSGFLTSTTADALFLTPAEGNAAYQPLDSDLTSWAGVTRAAGFDTFVATPSQANLFSLLTDETIVVDADIGSTVQAWDADLDSWAAITRASGFDTFVATPSAANFASLLTDDAFSMADAELGAIAGLTSAANRIPYFTGSGTAGLINFAPSDAGFDVLVGWDDSDSQYESLSLATIATEASPASGDFILIYGAEGDLRKVDWGDLPSGSGSLPADPGADSILVWDETTDDQAEWLAIPLPVTHGGTGQTTAAEAVGELTQALTEDTTPDRIVDMAAVYDNSADTGKKVALYNLSGEAVLATGTLSSAATLDIPLDETGYSNFTVFKLYLKIGTVESDGADLWIRFSDDGGATFEADSTDYGWRDHQQGVTDASDNEIVICDGGVGNASGEGFSAEITIYNAGAATETDVIAIGMRRATDGSFWPIHAIGRMFATAAATDIRVLTSTGDFSVDSWTLVGIK